MDSRGQAPNFVFCLRRQFIVRASGQNYTLLADVMQQRWVGGHGGISSITLLNARVRLSAYLLQCGLSPNRLGLWPAALRSSPVVIYLRL